MDAGAYDAFTAALQGSLAGRADVLGLVALGSMAGRDYQPDEFSDHDFFVVAAPASAEQLREDLSWLPARDRVLLSFRETAHGLKVLYDDGHLLELAVFAPEELALASVNRYRVLLDQADVDLRMQAVARATAEASAAGASTDEALLGLFLSALLVGVGRHLRGERASGRNLVHGQALRHLLVLLERHVPSPRSGLLDDLDPHRRFEAVHPDLGRQVDAALTKATPRAAVLLLDVAEQELRERVEHFPYDACAVVRSRLHDTR
jgi:hypothetical protein